MITKPCAIILRERVPDSRGEATGWIIVLAGENREREILAVISCKTGLEHSRSFAQMLATSYGVEKIEELAYSQALPADMQVTSNYSSQI